MEAVLNAYTRFDSTINLVTRKIRTLRKYHGINQAELADIILSNADRISKIEQGHNNYTAEDLRLICVHFGIEDMPLSEIDCKAFRKRLYMWRDLIRDKKFDEAQQWQKKMAAVVNLYPCDGDLPILYRLFEVAFLLYSESIDAAEEKLDYLRSIEDRMSVEHTYYFYYNQGLLNYSKMQYEESLKFHTKALKLVKQHKDFLPQDEGILLYNIATCYSNLELPYHVILNINKISRIYIEKQTERFRLALDMTLALNYSKIGRFEEAQELLDECLIMAKTLEDNICLASTLYNTGYTHMLMKSWEKAFEYFDEALQIFDEDSVYHYWGLYHQIYIKIEHEKYSDVKKLFARAKTKYPLDEIPFKSLQYYLSVSKRMKSHYDYNKEAVEYMENVTIPHFRSIHGDLEATNYCNLLEQYYENKTHRKFLAMAKIKGEIYNKMLFYSQGGSQV